MKEYIVKSIPNYTLGINGLCNDPLWEEANIIDDFSSPWEDVEISKAEFRALIDDERFYFCFKVFDNEIHIDKAEDIYDSINESDRVEIFFRTSDKLNPYYCLEIDPTARIMDFKAKPNKNFDFNWNWPKGELIVKSDIKDEAYTVEGVISIKSLKELGLIKGNAIEVGVYRAKYSVDEKGNFQPTWMPWVNPNTEEPNFHIASSFGRFNLPNK